MSDPSSTITGMCEICNGWTYDEVRADQRGHIATIGWTVQMVEPRPGRVGWSYTVGLGESYGHPELLTFSRDVWAAGDMLNRLGAAVRDGTSIEPRSTCLVNAVPIEAWEVHPVHLFGELVTTWRAIYSAREPAGRPELRVVQVRDLLVDDHGFRIRLDQPWARLPRL